MVQRYLPGMILNTMLEIVGEMGQLFRTRELFNTPTFVWCLKELQRHFGKVAAVMDRASPHRTKAVKKLLRENRNIKIIYLPKGSSYKHC